MGRMEALKPAHEPMAPPVPARCAGRDYEQASQRAVEAEFGVKLRNVKAAERRRAVFSLVGLVTDQEVETAEQELKDARAKRMEAREERRAEEERATRVEVTRARPPTFVAASRARS